MPARKPKTEPAAVTPGAPLNRKYRPQTFDADELIGQEHIVRTLKNAIRNDRLAQAYLFCGPRGTGKTSTARILAKAANCLDPDADKRPCNVCASCVAINTGATADVIEIDAASNRGIDDIRDLRERVNYAPSQLKRKFYIIDEAHQITGAAANAFLKTLEEPPAHTIFVLATTDPEELPATIISRCQRFDFRRHTVAGISSRIQALADREGIHLTPDAVTLVAELAHGSLRDPIGLLDQLANFEDGKSGKEISADDVRSLVGIGGHEAAVELLTAIVNKNAQTALQTIQNAVTEGQDPRQLNRQLTALIRSLLYLNAGASVPAGDEAIQALAKSRSLPELIQIANAFTETESSIRNAVIPQLPLEIATLTAILGPVQVPVAQPEPRANIPVQRPDPRPVAATHRTAPPLRQSEPPQRNVEPGYAMEPPRAAPSAAEPAPPIFTPAPDPDGSLSAIRDAWTDIRADVKALDRRTEALLMFMDPHAVQDGQLILLSAFDFHRNKLNSDEHRISLETAIERRIGRRLRVTTVVQSELLELMPTPTVAPEPTPAEQTSPSPQPDGIAPGKSDDERFLNAARSIFDGEILDDDMAL